MKVEFEGKIGDLSIRIFAEGEEARKLLDTLTQAIAKEFLKER